MVLGGKVEALLAWFHCPLRIRILCYKNFEIRTVDDFGKRGRLNQFMIEKGCFSL